MPRGRPKKGQEKRKIRKVFSHETEQVRLNQILTMQRQNDAIAMLLEGKETKEIANYISKKYKMKYSSALVYVSQARTEIRDREKYEIHNLVNLHIARYEFIYKELYAIGEYNGATMALKAKEKLLGFHKEGFHMKVTQGEIQSIQQIHVENEYDFVKLTPERRERFQVLMNVARKDNRIK